MAPFPPAPAREAAVPPGPRLATLQQVRTAGLALAVLAVLTGPADPRRGVVLAGLAGYLPVIAAAEILRRRRPAWVPVLGVVLLGTDAVWLVGALPDPGRALGYLALLEVVALTLLSTLPAGLALAGWFVAATATRAALMAPGARPGVPDLVTFGAALSIGAGTVAAARVVRERRLRTSESDLGRLAALAADLECSPEPAGVARALLRVVREALRGDLWGAAVVAGPDGQWRHLATEPPAPLRDRLIPAGSLPSGPTPAPGELMRLGRADLATRPDLASVLPGAEDLLVVALVAEQRLAGVLLVQPRPGARLSPRRLAWLQQAAVHGGLALRRAASIEQLQRLAATDELTKLANRRTLQSTLEREVARATRTGEPVSLVVLDLDHFKRLNDEHGHPAGDEALRNVAAALACACRPFDTPARYGGEEFAVVLPGCSAAEAGRIAERLRAGASAAPCAAPVTASAGVATCPDVAQDPDALLRAADGALYDAKRAGRNRTVVASAARDDREAVARRELLERLSRGDAPR